MVLRSGHLRQKCTIADATYRTGAGNGWDTPATKQLLAASGSAGGSTLAERHPGHGPISLSPPGGSRHLETYIHKPRCCDQLEAGFLSLAPGFPVVPSNVSRLGVLKFKLT